MKPDEVVKILESVSKTLWGGVPKNREALSKAIEAVEEIGFYKSCFTENSKKAVPILQAEHKDLIKCYEQLGLEHEKLKEERDEAIQYRDRVIKQNHKYSTGAYKATFKEYTELKKEVEGLKESLKRVHRINCEFTPLLIKAHKDEEYERKSRAEAWQENKQLKQRLTDTEKERNAFQTQAGARKRETFLLKRRLDNLPSEEELEKIVKYWCDENTIIRGLPIDIAKAISKRIRGEK